MIYQSENEKIKRIQKPSKEQSYINVIELSELSQVLPECKMTVKDIKDCKEMKYTKVEIYPEYICGTINMPNKSDLNESSSNFAFYIDKQKIIFIGKTAAEYKIIREFLRNDASCKSGVQHFIYRFLYSLIVNDYEVAEELEREINEIEESVLEKHSENLNEDLLNARKKLLYFHNFYERMLNISEMLADNDYKIFTFETVISLNHFSQYLNRLDGTIHTLLDYSLQVQQIYQAEIDIKQNKIMKVLTSVTTIFLPLTLIVGWYGMNFINMPELQWSFGYPLIFAISIIIVVVLIIYFKKNDYL